MGKRREQLSSFHAGMKEIKNSMPDQMNGFNALLRSAIKEGVLDIKTKELISVAIACFSRCEYCIVAHVYQALKHKASEKEILEAGMVTVLFGGGPAIAYVATVLNESLAEFRSDFL